MGIWGALPMNTVVIVDSNSKMIENYARMLEACKEEINCRYFNFPEKALEYIQKEGAAVLVCELEMPVMSGKEVFDMVEMISPATVKIAMSQVEDVRKTLEIVNQSRIFKLILKPFFLPEDMVEPIKSALKYYKLQEKKRNHPESMILALDTPDQKTKELISELEQKKQTYHNICQTMSSIVKANLQCGNLPLSEIEKTEIIRIFEGMLQEFMRYFMFGAQNYIFHINYLMNLFHAPEEHRSFQMKNRNSQEIPNEILQKIAYTIFITGYISREFFGEYQLQAVIEEKEEAYILELSCKLPKKEGKVAEVIMQLEDKMLDILAEKTLKKRSGELLIEKVYYKKGEVSDE